MLVTGIYRETFMPDWVYDASVDEIADFMRKELDEGVADTGVPAGLIKVSQNATGMTLTERKILEAACLAAQDTGAAIASHMAAFGATAGPTALAVIDALEGYGCSLDDQRFIWVHAAIDGVWTSVGDYAGGYRMIPAEFVPAMQEAGFSDELIAKLMHETRGAPTPGSRPHTSARRRSPSRAGPREYELLGPALRWPLLVGDASRIPARPGSGT